MTHSPAPAPAPTEPATRSGTLAAMATGFARRGGAAALRAPCDEGPVECSYLELDRRVRELARRLIGLGIEPGDRVAILGTTTPEWTVADLGVLATGAIVVPIYHTNAPVECAYVLSHSGARAVLCENDGQVARVESIRARCPALEHVLTFGGGDQGPLVDEGEVDARAAGVTPDDVATIVYTSGTTGPPKGCRLTHANLVAAMDGSVLRLGLDDSAVIFLFLPLAHVLARITQLVTLDVGGTLAYWRGDGAKVLDDLKAMSPTHVPAVPRIFEKIRTRALTTAQDGSRLERRVFDWALATGAAMRAAERAGTSGSWLRARHAIADRLVLARVRDLFGGRLEVALTGAAPIDPDVLAFFDACGVRVLEGYGLTETCASGTLNAPAAHRFGTVGRPLDGMECAIAADGEIRLAGPIVFAGYHDDPTATAAVTDGRWLLTGDLGELDDDGFLRVTGRKKDLIITSSGKNISPANIEAALRESRWVSQAVVIGDHRPYLVALLTLDSDEAPALAAEVGMECEPGAMAIDDRVRAVLQIDVDRANERFARIEQIKRFSVLRHDISQADGELTPSLKVKRQAVADHHLTDIDTLYAR
jgi:long-chain acyl-CoA synthetase